VEFLVLSAGSETEDPELEVHDMGSTNGMLVNGRKVPRATLRDGSQVKVGTTTMTVRIVRDDDGGHGV